MGNMIEWLRNGGNEMDYNMNNYMQNNNNGEMNKKFLSTFIDGLKNDESDEFSFLKDDKEFLCC